MYFVLINKQYTFSTHIKILLFFIPFYEGNHWHLHVINIGASRVKILSSLPLERDNKIPSTNKRITNVFGQCMKAHGTHST